MSAQPADQRVEDASLDAEITGIVAELLDEHGSELAALRALAHDFLVLLADADRSVSRGYLRGLFSQGARPVRDGDEP
ncbi:MULTISPECIES: hypothetical protein [unclassified Bosea (in: a-proteobacteria)]|uniref:hypothetical protein n=1 Tax=unclassified Bosea (in: a-proteobacteria) TaxID=2653178 RepID=UPI000F75244C|nr:MULTISPECIES: hypothetical protein [unclassified Bosea (in: a-proteobacteria)]AZO82110.1 hypothetical protein BLM15_30480 [Bosea sp. Tri-49]RXT24687.1 hypothetical protein B5U98_08605 [Bosea sp. Tri-39]RXT42522.1 hypothetical protein B5U99_01075 [Bosea sp. Tri-54]